MGKRDGRKLSREPPEAIRIRAVQRVEAGESPEDAIRVLGFHRPVVYDWLAKARERGLDVLRAKPVPGRPPSLQGKQLRWLYNTITGKKPAAVQTRVCVMDPEHGARVDPGRVSGTFE